MTLYLTIKVMDAAAFSLCMENNIPIVVFDFLDQIAWLKFTMVMSLKLLATNIRRKMSENGKRCSRKNGKSIEFLQQELRLRKEKLIH